MSVPVVANGDIKSIADATRVGRMTGVDGKTKVYQLHAKSRLSVLGVMAARGILHNPAMYAGFDITPRKCVHDWVQLK